MNFSAWRDVVLFLSGLGLTINEALIREGQERPSLIMLYAGMMGLPAVLRADERRRTPSREPRPGEQSEEIPG